MVRRGAGGAQNTALAPGIHEAALNLLGEAVEVDEETARLLDYAAILFEQSGGLFDITSGVLRELPMGVDALLSTFRVVRFS